MSKAVNQEEDNGLDKVLRKCYKELDKALTAYNPSFDSELLLKTTVFGAEKHKHQKRSSGEPYMTHPVEVAQILAKLRMDQPTIIAALLHDTVEDTDATLEDIQQKFGVLVRDLVDGVTKIGKITFRTSEEKQAENFRKMLLAMAKDIRVIIIKLADRTHNMRTLTALKESKRMAIAQETLDIYAPIANRLGISWMKIELEDLCLRHLKPDIYYRISSKISKKKKERDQYIEQVCMMIEEKLKEYDLKGFVTGRPKHFYSIYKKMESRGMDYDQIHDIIAFRITLDNITECYKALGVIHASWIPIPGRFKDYIAMPKANKYQSLHTTVIGPKRERIEIQIRTHEMHKIAEEGIAAHWSYKEGSKAAKSHQEYQWVRELLEHHQDLTDPAEFLESVKTDLFANEIFIFTPAGDIKQMPWGATPLDFAYSVHSDVGHRCIGAKANGKIVPLNYKMKSGDTMEIITSQSQTPSKDWLKIVKSPRAKAKIRSYIKSQERERAKAIGKSILEKEARTYGISLSNILKAHDFFEAIKAFGKSNPEDLYAMVGYGRMDLKDILSKMPSMKNYLKQTTEEADDKSFLERIFDAAKRKSDGKNAVIVDDIGDVLVRFGKCCNPIPGDAIVGFVTRGRGITVHVSSCKVVLDSDEGRRIDVTWRKAKEVKRPVKIRVICRDEPGVLATLTKTITQSGFNISEANVRATKDGRAICIFEIEVSSHGSLEKVIKGLMARKEVLDVGRSAN